MGDSGGRKGGLSPSLIFWNNKKSVFSTHIWELSVKRPILAICKKDFLAETILWDNLFNPFTMTFI